MEFLKRLFGSGGGRPGGSPDDPNALMVYVKVRKCGAIARVRIDMRNDLSMDEDGANYVVRKSVVDNVCYGMAELELHFDSNRNELSRNLSGGEFTTREAYEQQERERAAARAG
jgi:hypothetical protein